MLASPLLLALAAATAVTASSYHQAIHPGALAAKRDLVARQSSTDDGTSAATSCLSGLMSIYSSLPTPPPEILSWEQTATFDDPCSITVPGSISAAFSSYESEALSWYTAHSSDLDAALSQCPQYSSVAGGSGDSAPPVCTGGSGVGGSGAGATTTTDSAGQVSTTTTAKSSSGTGTSAGAGSGASSTTSAGAASTQSKNAGPRETGFVAGAVAVAGFLGVVAAL